jgi:hypothetical protein
MAQRQLAEVTRNVQKIFCPCATFSITDLKWITLKIDPDLRGKKPATNVTAGLNYGTK